jgi:hypothetical protein
MPRGIVRGYRDVSRAVLNGRHHEVPALLEEMGIRTAGGGPLSDELIAPALDLVREMLDEKRPYRFGVDDQVFRRFVEVNSSRLGEVRDLRFPHHIVFINRTVVGHFGNLSRLRAMAPWRQLLEARLKRTIA